MKTWAQKWHDANPCDKCQDREPGCHSKCDKYKNWRTTRQQELDKIKDAKRLDRIKEDQRHDGMRKAEKARRKKY